MKRTILHIQDANMAGSEWSYSIWLTRSRDRSFTLTVQHLVRDEEPLDIEPASGLMTGVEVYRTLAGMLEEAGYDLNEMQVEAVAREIEHVDEATAAEFRAAPELIEAQDEAERLAAEDRQREILKPFAVEIESYVARFSDEKLHYPGAGRVYPSRRFWMRRFMEDYVLAHGALPLGKHDIKVAGYSGGTHDFSDRKLE